MYEMQQIKSVDYYSLIIGEDRDEELEDLDRINQYRSRMGVYYGKFIEQVSFGLDERRRSQLAEWFEFNKDFIGFMKNSELNMGLEGILLKIS